MTAEVVGLQKYCTFDVGGQWFALPLDVVQEITKSVEPTPVPRSSDVLAGVINLRGDIVTVIDLAKRLQLQSTTIDAENSMSVVTRLTGGVVCLRADHIGEVVQIHSDDFKEPPGTIAEQLRTVVTAVHVEPGGHLLQLLDPETLIPRVSAE